MLPTLTIEASDGTTKATLDCTTAEATFTRRGMDRATATVDEADYAAVSIDPIADRLFVDRPDGTRLFGGRFDDDERDGVTVRVTIASFRRDAIDAEPTGRSLTFQNVADTTVVQDAIDSVPTLSAGTLEELAPALSFEFPNSSRAKQIRKAAVATGAAVRYNPDRTVDYVGRLGSDRTLTLSPTNQNLVDGISVTEDVRDRVTHVRAFGSRELNLTRDAVTASYSGGRQVWRKFEDTDIRSADRLQQIADRLATEYDGEPRELTVEATVVGEDLQRGDTVTVRLPDRDIDRTMTVTRLIERFGQRGRELVVTLMNRLVDDDATTTGRESLQRFNRGYQGFVDRNQVTSGWNPAGDGVAQSLEITAWPDDIVSEELVELTVLGRAWRSPVDTAGHSHSLAVQHPEHTHDVTGTTNLVQSETTTEDFSASDVVTLSEGTFQQVESFSLSNRGWPHLVRVGVGEQSTESIENIEVRLGLDNDGDGIVEEFIQVIDGFDSGPVSAGIGGLTGTTAIFQDLASASAATLQLGAQTASGNDPTVSYYITVDRADPHGHGITETSGAELGTTTQETTTTESDLTPTVVDRFNGTSYFPSDIEIRVNGSLITTLSGDTSARSSDTVDLTGELTAGSNTIEASPTGSRGALNLILASELFRRGP